MPNARPAVSVHQLLSVPNLLSLARIPLAVLAWWQPADKWFLILLMIIAAVTDVLDGLVARLLARRAGETSAEPGIGAWLDPVCDKVFVVSVVLAVLLTYQPPTSTVVLILTRDLLQFPLWVLFVLVTAGHRVVLDYRAAASGKLTTVLQFASIMSILFLPALTTVLAVMACVMGLMAVAVMARRSYLTWQVALNQERLGLVPANPEKALSGSK